MAVRALEDRNPFCKFVVTLDACEGEVNCCEGVFDTPNEVLGYILSAAIDKSGDEVEYHNRNLNPGEPQKEIEFKVKFSHDDANDDYYDIDIDYNGVDTEKYRVFYLRT